jgi:hypothetical protein
VDEPAPEAVEHVLEVDPGISDLALDGDGALWMVSERDDSAYRVTLDGDALGEVTRVEVTGTPDGLDLEGIGVLGSDRFVFGTEGATAQDAQVFGATRTGGAIALEIGVELAVEAGPNHGIESLCTFDGRTFAAAEDPVLLDGKRVAQIVDVDSGHQARVALTSETGKLSDMDCRLVDGALDVLAIERHFETSRIVHFTLPRVMNVDAIIPSTVVRDLADLIRGRNLEGLARLPDGRIAIVNDNQSGGATVGATTLVILPAAP